MRSITGNKNTNLFLVWYIKLVVAAAADVVMVVDIDYAACAILRFKIIMMIIIIIIIIEDDDDDDDDGLTFRMDDEIFATMTSKKSW